MTTAKFALHKKLYNDVIAFGPKETDVIIRMITLSKRSLYLPYLYKVIRNLVNLIAMAA